MLPDPIYIGLYNMLQIYIYLHDYFTIFINKLDLRYTIKPDPNEIMSITK